MRTQSLQDLERTIADMAMAAMLVERGFVDTSASDGIPADGYDELEVIRKTRGYHER